MSEADVAVVRELLERGGGETVVIADAPETRDLFHPGVEPVFAPAEGSEAAEQILAGAGNVSARELYRRWVEAFDDYREIATDVIDAGPGRVLVLGEMRGRTRFGGVEIEHRGAVLYTIRDEKVSGVELFQSHADGYAAAGLSPPPRRQPAAG